MLSLKPMNWMYFLPEDQLLFPSGFLLEEASQLDSGLPLPRAITERKCIADLVKRTSRTDKWPKLESDQSDQSSHTWHPKGAYIPRF